MSRSVRISELPWTTYHELSLSCFFLLALSNSTGPICQ
jgi:hypothetical protein